MARYLSAILIEFRRYLARKQGVAAFLRGTTVCAACFLAAAVIDNLFGWNALLRWLVWGGMAAALLYFPVAAASIQAASIRETLEVERPVFHENLQKRFPGTAIHRGDAEDLGKWLQPQKSGLADAVVSGLPWTLFTESQCRSILAEIASCMQPDGIFVTLCYWHAQWLPSGLRLKKLLKDYFDAVEMTDTVWTNVPPIFLFRCSGRRLTPKKEKR